MAGGMSLVALALGMLGPVGAIESAATRPPRATAPLVNATTPRPARVTNRAVTRGNGR